MESEIFEVSPEDNQYMDSQSLLIAGAVACDDIPLLLSFIASSLMVANIQRKNLIALLIEKREER